MPVPLQQLQARGVQWVGGLGRTLQMDTAVPEPYELGLVLLPLLAVLLALCLRCRDLQSELGGSVSRVWG